MLLNFKDIFLQKINCMLFRPFLIALTALLVDISILSATATNTNTETHDKIPVATDSLSIHLSANLQSRHLWRGSVTCSAWNIQPTATVSKRNFLVGFWGAYTVNNSYSEVNLYGSYTIGRFSVAVLDYFCPDETLKFNRLFDTNQKTTQHTVDATLTYNGTKKFPLSLMVSTLVWGDDINATTEKNYYSTYIEAGYTWERTQTQKFEFFAGITPVEGYYANSLNLVNMGFSASQTINVSSTFKLPIFGKIIANPHTQNLYFVFGATIGS